MWGPKDGTLYMKYRDIRHIVKDYTGPNKFGLILQAWEQSYLCNIIFPGDSPKAYFSIAGFAVYAGQILFYNTSPCIGKSSYLLT